jgi:hypothetical protein
MKKKTKNNVSKACFILSADVLMQKYDYADFENNTFFTKLAVVHKFSIAIPP